MISNPSTINHIHLHLPSTGLPSRHDVLHPEPFHPRLPVPRLPAFNFLCPNLVQSSLVFRTYSFSCLLSTLGMNSISRVTADPVTVPPPSFCWTYVMHIKRSPVCVFATSRLCWNF
jgi:hypothetical protein